MTMLHDKVYNREFISYIACFISKKFRLSNQLLILLKNYMHLKHKQKFTH